jgi:cobalamin biosynthesis protein CobD/CbiB
MSLIAILGALLLEQIFPLSSYTRLRLGLRTLIDYVERALAMDQVKPWQTFWFITLVGALLAGLLSFVTHAVHPLLGLLFTIAILYLTIGIRQFSHFYSKIRLALTAGDDAKARTALVEWLHEEAELTGYRGNIQVAQLSETQLIRQSLEMAILSSLRYVFAGLFWFLVFAPFKLGVAGVVFYRLADLLARRWHLRAEGKQDAYTVYARKMMNWIEFLPARCAAVIFAVVGNFEEAMYAWRTQSGSLRQLGETDAAAVTLTSGAGALGVTLREGVSQRTRDMMDEHELALYGEDVALKADEVKNAGQIGTGPSPDVRSLNSGVGLFWRATIFVLLGLMMLTLAKILA